MKVPWPPTRAELAAATARTAAAISDPAASLADIERAAELEQAAFTAYLTQPGADAELQAEAEAEMDPEAELLWRPPHPRPGRM